MWIRKGQGKGPREQGGAALKHRETLRSEFAFLHCCRLTKNWARRGYSASPRVSGGVRVLGDKVHSLNLLKFIFQFAPFVEFFEFWQMHRVVLLPPQSRPGKVAPPHSPHEAKMPPGAPAVCSMLPLLPAPGNHRSIPMVLPFPERSHVVCGLGVGFLSLRETYLRFTQVAWIGNAVLLVSRTTSCSLP